MPQPASTAVLNELLAAEQGSVATRLKESTPFISRVSVELVEAVKPMERASREHAALLVEAILDRGGFPGPRVRDPRSADLHYQELRFILPRLVTDCEGLIGQYEQAADRLSDDAEAARLVRQILQRHRDELARLQSLGGRLAPQAAAAT